MSFFAREMTPPREKIILVEKIIVVNALLTIGS
jgi:hypothetical protein